MIKSKLGQRVVGALLMIAAAGFTASIWHTALTEGYYYRKTAALFPAFIVIGLGLLLFPIDVEKLKAEHGVERAESMSQLPPVWWGVVVVAVAAGLGNWYALAQL